MRLAKNTIGLFALVSTALLVGCAETTPELFILDNQPLADDCTIESGSTSTTVISAGSMDVLFAQQYTMHPRIENTMVDSETVEFTTGGGGGNGGLQGAEWEANQVSLRRATVRYNPPDVLASVFPDEVTIPISGAVGPGGTFVASLNVISPQLAQTLASLEIFEVGAALTLLIEVEIEGETSAGNNVDSNRFVYPIQLCAGCSVVNSTGTCAAGGGDDTDELCAPGTDFYSIDCGLVCPAPEGADPRIGDVCSAFGL